VCDTDLAHGLAGRALSCRLRRVPVTVQQLIELAHLWGGGRDKGGEVRVVIDEVKVRWAEGCGCRSINDARASAEGRILQGEAGRLTWPITGAYGCADLNAAVLPLTGLKYGGLRSLYVVQLVPWSVIVYPWHSNRSWEHAAQHSESSLMSRVLMAVPTMLDPSSGQ